MTRTNKRGEKMVNIGRMRESVRDRAALAAKKDGVRTINFIEQAVERDPRYQATLKEQHGSKDSTSNKEGSQGHQRTSQGGERSDTHLDA